MNTTSVEDGFKCPEGFVKEDVSSQLYFEDVDEDSELWLLRIPHDVDLAAIENREIELDERCEIKSCDGEKIYECVSETCELPNICLVLPHKSDKHLSGVAKTFKGNIFISEWTLPEVGVKMEVEDEDSFLVPEPKLHKRNKTGETSGLDPSNLCNLDIGDTEPSSSQKNHSRKESKTRKKKSSHPLNNFKNEPISDLDEFPNCDSQKK